MRDIPIIPVCHSGLLPHDLKMPMSLKQGISLRDEDGLRRVYKRVAEVLACDVPSRDFVQLARELVSDQEPVRYASTDAVRELEEGRGIRKRLTEASQHPKYNGGHWRTLERVSIEAATSEEKAADLLRSDPSVLL